MKQMMVRYTVKPERAAENEMYVKQVFEQLHREQPAGLRYATFKLADGVSFMHLVSVETADGSNPLRELTMFKAFTTEIQDRCAEPPVTVDLQNVGAYAWFGE